MERRMAAVSQPKVTDIYWRCDCPGIQFSPRDHRKMALGEGMTRPLKALVISGCRLSTGERLWEWEQYDSFFLYDRSATLMDLRGKWGVFGRHVVGEPDGRGVLAPRIDWFAISGYGILHGNRGDQGFSRVAVAQRVAEVKFRQAVTAALAGDLLDIHPDNRRQVAKPSVLWGNFRASSEQGGSAGGEVAHARAILLGSGMEVPISHGEAHFMCAAADGRPQAVHLDLLYTTIWRHGPLFRAMTPAGWSEFPQRDNPAEAMGDAMLHICEQMTDGLAPMTDGSSH